MSIAFRGSVSLDFGTLERANRYKQAINEAASERKVEDKVISVAKPDGVLSIITDLGSITETGLLNQANDLMKGSPEEKKAVLNALCYHYKTQTVSAKPD